MKKRKNKLIQLLGKIFFFLTVLFTLLNNLLAAHTPVQINERTLPLSIEGNITFWACSNYENEWSFAIIQDTASFMKYEEKPFTGCKFMLRNKDKDSTTFYIYHPVSIVWVADIRDSANRCVLLKKIDKTVRYSFETLPFTQTGIAVTIPPNGVYEVRLWTKEVRSIFVYNFLLLTKSGFIKQRGSRLFAHRYRFLFNALLVSVLFFQMAISLFQWFLVRRIEYIWYALYLSSLFCYYGNQTEGYYNLDVFFNYNIIPEVLLGGILSLIVHFFYFRFARYYLELEKKQPKLNQKIILSEYFVLIVSLVGLGGVLLEEKKIALFLFYGASLFLFGLAIYFIREVLKARNPLAKYLLIGALFALVGNAIAIIFSWLMLWGIFLVSNAVVFSGIGTLIEVFFFNIALLYKVRNIEAEKLWSQDALIKELEKNEQLNQKMQQIRDKISQDLHDDIGATLSSIKIYSEVARHQWQKDPHKVLLLLERIHTNATNILDAMGDIVWSINPKRDKLEDITFKMNTHLREMLDIKNIPFSFEVSASLKTTSLGMNVRKNIFLIFKEAINNIAKYSEATEVFICLNVINDTFDMEVHDNGKGFDIHEKSAQNGIYNMKKRTEELGGTFKIVSEKGKGTHIFCQIPNIRDL